MQKGLQTDILPKKPLPFEPAPTFLGLVEEELSKNTLSIVDLVNALLVQAHGLRASDIHIDPTDRGVKVRLRIDGVMHEKFLFPNTIHPEVISRIKVLSWLRTDEHQAAQDGRFRVMLPQGQPVDVRVSITPTYFGENAVLRLLADKEGDFSLDALGFSPEDQEKIVKAIKRPHGMILATGPTGSGKTTTLYTLIKMLNTKDVSIVTIEDPIEYAVSDITQIQINPRTGLTFAQGLRSILRQDPNIIMVGEIRDPETASIAVNTALTGHLLLSTLHTSDAATTLPRLLDMGIDPYLVASTAELAIGQRLVRRICKACITEVQNDKGEIEYQGSGCAVCDGSGYYGRIGLNEVLVVDQQIREAILEKESADVIRKIAIQNGMTTMYEDGLAKARRGETTITELLRAINE
ncbi:GspE/PulE family protein [Candidatus Parcubacteria bacterium]|nr:GspE/PulE family protein [Candidatus Parcubacteria bacterium]